MSSIIRHIPTLKIALPAILTALAAALTACSDSPLDSPAGATGSRVSFDVTTASGWNALTPMGRSAAAAAPIVTELTDSASTTLYLIGSPAAYAAPTASRGAVADDSTIDDFSVYATLASPADYMNNVRVTRSSGWLPDEEYLWPGDGSLRFNAFSPAASAPGENGITSLPDPAADGSLILGFRTPEAAADQPDLLWATPVDASASPCALTFNHALTAVSFVAGPQMPPCTIETITLSGILSEGSLDITSGEWSALSTPASFTAPTADDIFMLIPQTLPDDATVAIDLLMADGSLKSLSASLAGAEWPAGVTMRYRISTSASADRLVLEAVDADGAPLTSISTPYTGSSVDYTIRSYYASTAPDGSETRSPIEWDATLIDADGTTLDALPSWIKALRTSGADTAGCTLATRLRAPEFLEMNPHTKTLRQAADINQSSGYSTYNLASASGAPEVENTANCYIINAPGHYSIPLVYGNAVKDGEANEAAYVSTLSATTANKRKALMTFVNHLGNEISDPYIYNNPSCTPAGASLLWEERISTVTNVALSADHTALTFDIPAEFIRQGNAVVGVTDADGNVMWSWHLWLTDYRAGSDLYTLDGDNTTFRIYPVNMGRIYGGDKTLFSAAKATLRLTQRNVPAGLEPLSIDIAIDQAESTITTIDSYPFYQWGRKDPMIAGVEHYYDSTGRIMDGSSMPTAPFGSTHLEMIKTSILRPGMFVTTSESALRRISPYYCNLWDITHIIKSPSGMQEDNVKTIYDPCPVGSKVSVGNDYRTLAAQASFSVDGHDIIFTAPDGSTIDFTMYGYREISGHDILSKSVGTYWTAVSGGPALAQEFVVNSGKAAIQSNDAIYGFGIRPIAE